MLEEAVLFLLREKREEYGSSLKSIQIEIEKGHDMGITLREALGKRGRIEELIDGLEQQQKADAEGG